MGRRSTSDGRWAAKMKEINRIQVNKIVNSGDGRQDRARDCLPSRLD